MAYIYDLTDTWNAGGTTFNGIKLNVTDSASAVSSKLVTLQTNGTEHFSVTKAGVGYFSGNVGIGTTSPADKFVVSNGGAAGLEFDPVSGFITTYNRSTSAWTKLTTRASSYSFNLQGAVDAVNIDSSGNVGIGTTTPAYKLDVNGAIGIPSGFSGAHYNMSYAGNANSRSWRIVNDLNAYGDFSISQSTTQTGNTFASQLYINPTGNVGIGTSSPGAKLDVVGNAYVRSGVMYSDTFSAYSGGNLSINAGAGFMAFATSATERMRIDSSGNLLVGTTSGSSSSTDNGLILRGDFPGFIVSRRSSGGGQAHMLFVNGGTEVGSITTSTTNTTYTTSSDARLKHDIVDAPEASSLIDAIQVRSFKWNADNSKQRYGMVAQELLEVAPEAVSQPEDPDEMMGVDYSKLVPMLVKELQSLRARVAELEGN